MGVEEQIENSVLLDAYNVVHEERDPEYGPPSEDFESLGILWATLINRYLKKHGLHPIPNIPPRVVGNMMIALKINRDVHYPKRDNMIDVAGYAENVER
jgi:hypothetical protein